MTIDFFCVLFLFNRTNITTMTTSVSTRWNISCIMFKMIAFFIITLSPGYMSGLTFYSLVESTCNDCIISIRDKVCSHTRSLITPLFIEVPVSIRDSQRSCICVLEFSILPLSIIQFFDIRTVPTYFVFRFIVLGNFLLLLLPVMD